MKHFSLIIDHKCWQSRCNETEHDRSIKQNREHREKQ